MRVEAWPREEAIDEALARELAPGAAVVVGAAVGDGPRRLTWDALVDACARAAAPGLAPLDPIARRLALRAAVAVAAAGTPLEAAAGARPVIGAASKFLDEVDGAAVTDDELARAVELLPEGAARSRVALLARAAAAARATTGTLGATPARRRAAALAGLRSGAALPAVVAEASVIDVAARLVWDPIDAALAAALAARLGGRPVVFGAFWSGRPALDAGLEEVVRALEAAGVEVHGLEASLVDVASVATPALAPVVRGLWGGEPTVDVAPLALVECPSPRHEARVIAARVRALVDRGTAPERIAIAARSPRDVAARLDEELARVGLALDDRRGPSLASSPLGRLVGDAMALPRRGWAREDTLAVLGHRLVAAAVPWQDMVRGAELHLVARAARALGVRELAPDGDGFVRVEAKLAALAESFGAAGELVPRLRGLLAPLAAAPRRASIAVHARALTAALEALGVFRRARVPVEPGDAGPLAAAIDRGAARDQAAADALEDLLADLPVQAARLGAGDAAIPAGAFAALVEDLMAELPLRRLGARGGAVRLVALAELAGRRFEHVFVPHLIEGAAPAWAIDDGLWGEGERRLLDSALRKTRRRPGAVLAVGGVAERGEATPIERLLLTHALAVADGTVTLSWAREVDGGGHATRSPFVDEVVRACPWASIERTGEAPIPSLTAARAPADLLARAALEVLAEPAGRLLAVDASMPPAALAAAVAQAIPARAARVSAMAAIERARWEVAAGRAPRGPFAGAVGDHAVLRRLATAASPLATTALERAANCAFTFFAERVLGVDALDEASDDAPPKDEGTLAHDCLHTFWARRIAAGDLTLRGDAAERAEVEAIVDATLAEVGGGAGHPALRHVLRARTITLVTGGLDADRDAWGDGGPRPRFVELAFGHAGDGDVFPPLHLDGDDGDPVVLAGRFDRVDVAPGGTGALVIDYKRSRASSQGAKLSPRELPVRGLQLLVYTLAADAGLRARGLLDAGTTDAGFVGLRDGKRTRTLRTALGKAFPAEDYLASGGPARVRGIVHALRAGDVPAAPHDCTGCSHRTVCRVIQLNLPDEEGGP